MCSNRYENVTRRRRRGSSDDYHYLQIIANFLGTISKIVTVIGAGISTDIGIPDFRSKTGIYSLVDRHLFYSSVLFNPESRSLFYRRIADIRRDAKNANPTKTHHFIRNLHDSGKLVRDYTQNIDYLEEMVGLSTDIGVEYVLLYRSLYRLRCSNCPGTFSWHEGGREMESLSGPGPPCPGYTKISDDRKAKGKRVTAIGKLRPDIVLYDEQDPRAEAISAIVSYDQSLRPDVLLIIGTSLTTYGVQLLIRDFAKVIHKRRTRKVVFVNRIEPAKS
ncbi:DHS-like NAD/FAD-binding domain-containing protein [Corynascus novoguineensis]|uniref:DHS-like NAD/FAD-binding domain-containing protein n=1 Tax=Corynascus novoguineensis TaxID=1126955 RepID=A0AAN7HFA7_9PEZI|nr:DHS-like NAD/FAD-binding domain-containing protein [Corynascus novoguineensis]